jgi:hypothetical protein
MTEEKTFYVSFFLTREKSNDDDESWFDRKHISDEIKSWLTDIDYQVDDIKIFNTIRKEID